METEFNPLFVQFLFANPIGILFLLEITGFQMTLFTFKNVVTCGILFKKKRDFINIYSLK